MMMQNAEFEILAILRRNDANFAGKLLTRAVNLEKIMYKKAANPHADQSKGLTASETTASGRCGNYTTSRPKALLPVRYRARCIYWIYRPRYRHG